MRSKLLIALLLVSTISFTQINNLVAYYPFNGNANDESGAENNGTVYGATLTTDRFGNTNSAYLFDGVDDYIECINPGPLGTSPRTISFWAKTDFVANNNYGNVILSYGISSSSYDYGGRLDISVNSKVNGLACGVGGAEIVKDFDTSDKLWHFYTVVFEGGENKHLDDLLFYADGVLLSTTASYLDHGHTINTKDELAIHIGKLHDYGRNYKGSIDDIKLYNKALSADEIIEEFKGLVAYYPFNGNADDESGFNHNGIVDGATLTTDRFGNANSAYSFDGSNDYIQIDNNANININENESYTISYWVKHNGANKGKYMISKYKGSFGEPSYALGTGTYDDAYSWFEFTSGNGIENRGTIDLNDDAWHNITTVFTSGESVSIYVDGVLDISNAVTHTGSIINENNLTIGCGANFAQYYNGSIDDIRIYKKALTEDEISTEINGLVAYYPFSGNANDESGNNNHGIVSGPILANDRFDNTNSSYYFDGSNDVITIPHQSYLSALDELTLSVWIKPESFPTSGSRMILGKSDYSSKTNYLLRLKPGGLIQFEYKTFANATDNPLVLNEWNHIVVVANSADEKKVYINNILATHTTDSSPFGTVTNPITFGSATYGGGAEQLIGNLDEIRIYKTALSTEEVSELFNDNSLAINQNLVESGFYVANNILHINDYEKLNTINSISIYNILGQKALEISEINDTTNIDGLINGIYILKIEYKSGKYSTLKFIVE